MKVSGRRVAATATVVAGLVYLTFFFNKLLIDGTMDFTGDAVRFYYPSWWIGKNMLSEGFFFLWEPFRCMGQPFAAAPSNQAFYPLRLLSLFVGYLAYQKIFVVFHVGLASVFGYLVAKDRLRDRAAAVFCALAFGFNGFFVARIGYASDFATIAWVAPALYFLNRERAAPLGIVLTLQWLAGFPPMSLLTLVLVTVFSLPHRTWRVVGKAVLVMIGLGAFQILPFLQMLSESGRPVFLGAAAAVEHSIAPIQALKALFLPAAFSTAASAVPLLENFYVGPVVFLCFCFGFALAYRRDKKTFVLGLVGAVFLLLSFGRYLPLYTCIPGVTLFKFPSNWTMPFVAIAILVAGFGLKNIRRRAVKALLVAGAAVELFAHYHKLPHPQVPETFFTETKQRLTALRQPTGTARIFHVPSIINGSPEWGRDNLDNWTLLKGIMTPSFGTANGFFEAASHHNLTGKRNLDYVKRMMHEGPSSPLLNYARIGVIVAIDTAAAKKTPPDREDFVTIANANIKPRAFFAKSNKAVVILDDKPGRVVVEAEGPGELVVSESYYPGWTVRIDDRRAAVRAFEDNFLAVSLPEGRRRVEFRYSPVLFWFGLFVSGGTVLVVVFGWGRRRQNTPNRNY